MYVLELPVLPVAGAASRRLTLCHCLCLARLMQMIEKKGEERLIGRDARQIFGDTQCLSDPAFRIRDQETSLFSKYLAWPSSIVQ